VLSSLPDLQKERGFPYPSRKKNLLKLKRESTPFFTSRLTHKFRGGTLFASLYYDRRFVCGATGPLAGFPSPLAHFREWVWAGRSPPPGGSHRVPSRTAPLAKHQRTVLAYLVAFVKRQEVCFGRSTDGPA
jgi:hypothetical protein